MARGSTCEDMFDAATLAKLGDGPKCFSRRSPFIRIWLGRNANLAVNDNIVLAGSGVTSLMSPDSVAAGTVQLTTAEVW